MERDRFHVVTFLAPIRCITLLVFGIIIIEISLVGCVGDMILEKEYTHRLKVEQIENSPVELYITGLAMHSALVVSKIDTSQSDDVLQLKIYLRLVSFAPAGSSGSFAYHLVVPETVHKVTLGEEQAIIWMRNFNAVTTQATPGNAQHQSMGATHPHAQRQL